MATAVSVIWKQINTRPLPYEISLWMANRKWMPNRCQSKWENDVQHEQLHIRSTYKHQYAEHFRKTQSRDQTKLTHKSPENIQDKLSICITVPNFTLFSRTTRRYSVFRFFMMAAVRHLGFLKVWNLILFGTSRAIDIIHSSYYIHGPWRAKKNFCCFICVSYGPYTLL